MHSYQGTRMKEILGRNRSRRKDLEMFFKTKRARL
jgi:hypothetical protein